MADTNTDDLAQFPSQISQAIDGLLWLGFLEQEVSYCGHTFILRTMKGSEELETSLIAKEYLESLGQVKAYTWATIAGALYSVDGNKNFASALGPDRRADIRSKFNYISNNWYWPVALKLHEEYLGLERKQLDAIKAVEDLSTRTPSNS